MLTSGESDNFWHSCSVLAPCLTHTASAACPFQPIWTTKSLCGNLFSSNLDKSHPIPLTLILSVSLIKYFPPQIALLRLLHLCHIQCELLLLAFIKPSLMPGFASAAHVRFLRCVLSLGQSLDSSRHTSKWSSGESATQSGAGGFFHAPPGWHLRKIKGRAFGAHDKRGTLNECEVQGMKKLWSDWPTSS